MSEAERKSEHTPVSYTSEELIGAARFCFADPKYHNCFGCPLEHKPCDNLERLLANRLELCEAALRARFPAADVEPVVRGEWIGVENITTETTVRCSVCGNLISAWYKTKRCAECGAHMERSGSGE